MLRYLRALVVASICFSVTPLWADDVESSIKEIRSLLTKRQAVEAEAKFQEALKANPDAKGLDALRPLLFSGLMQAGKVDSAIAHAEVNLQRTLQDFRANKGGPPAVIQATSMVAVGYQRLSQMDKAVATYEATLGEFQTAAKNGETDDLLSAIGDTRRSIVQTQFQASKPDLAKELIQKEVNESQSAFDADSMNAKRAIRLINAIELKINLDAVGVDNADPAPRNELRKLVKSQLEQHITNPQLLTLFMGQSSYEIRMAAMSDPDRAEVLLEELREYLKQLKDREGAPEKLISNSINNLRSMEPMIAAERKRLALIGRPAFPLDVEKWTNGAAPADIELTGKVVLLDFWAVWCGPCIATFPHLREWNEKYGPQGLEIIGVTRYYEYGWDAESNRPKGQKGISQEDELAAMQLFAEHHKLSHRFAITPKDTKFHDDYGVTGIPQAVLIDRKGVIRMIRVGSGDKNAHDLHEMIEKLIKE